MFSWFGHQSRFAKLVCMTGHLPALLSSVFASIFFSDHVLEFEGEAARVALRSDRAEPVGFGARGRLPTTRVNWNRAREPR